MLAAESARKAWLLRERVSDRERFYIDFTYDRHGTGNLEKAYQTLELWAQTYPRRGGGNADPRGLLAGISSQGTGRFQTAIEIAQERIAGEPNQASAYGLLASAYLRTDRFAEVESTLQRAFERKLETPTILVNRYNIAVLKGDQEEMNRVVSQARGKPRSEHWVAHQEALALARSGRFRPRAVHPTAPWNWPCKSRSDAESAASYLASRAVWEAFYGNCRRRSKDRLGGSRTLQGTGR